MSRFFITLCFIVAIISVWFHWKDEQAPKLDIQVEPLCIQLITASNTDVKTEADVLVAINVDDIHNSSLFDVVLVVGHDNDEVASNTHVLNGNSFVVHGCLFIGTQLWKYGDVKHSNAIRFIIDTLDMNIEYDCVIVITDYAPHLTGEDSVMYRYNSYSQDLSSLLFMNNDVIKLWAHGEGNTYEYKYGVRVVSKPGIFCI